MSSLAQAAAIAGVRYDGVRNGWPALLSSLTSYLETGEALDITKRWACEGR